MPDSEYERKIHFAGTDWSKLWVLANMKLWFGFGTNFSIYCLCLNNEILIRDLSHVRYECFLIRSILLWRKCRSISEGILNRLYTYKEDDGREIWCKAVSIAHATNSGTVGGGMHLYNKNGPAITAKRSKRSKKKTGGRTDRLCTDSITTLGGDNVQFRLPTASE